MRSEEEEEKERAARIDVPVCLSVRKGRRTLPVSFEIVEVAKVSLDSRSMVDGRDRVPSL